MKKLSTTKELQEKLQSRRNLFGLGVTSLIAACGADGAGGGDDDLLREEDTFTSTLPFKAKKLLEPKSDLAEAKALTKDEAGGYTTTISATGTLAVIVDKPMPAMDATLSFDGASKGGADVGIYQLIPSEMPSENKYDLVISAPFITSAQAGTIFIYWNVATVTELSTPHLEIKSTKIGDKIGIHAPEFFQLGGATTGGYDMVIRGPYVGKDSTKASTFYEGAIYVLWDVKSYSPSPGKRAFDLSDAGLSADSTGATAGSLAIYGAKDYDQIGIFAPDFLQLGGVAGDKLDMVIRSEWVDNRGTGENNNNTDEGAIYVLWDVEDYYKDVNEDPMIQNKRIDLGAASNDSNGHYATAGLLTIYGAAISEQIGAHAPEFLQLGGKDKNYDMVIRSERWIDKDFDGENDVETEEEVSGQAGAIYILWDINDYYKDTSKHKRIDLEVGTDDPNYANSGLLTIKGAKAGDWIGINPLEFLQLGKKNDKYDLIIRSEHVDNSSAADTGAIYVLWDVADYANQNVSIDLANTSSGLLTIYGREGDSKLGSSDILYKADNEDSDVDGDGTNDLVFKDKDYTYVIFGDQLGAVNAGTGKVASKTIDLNMITGISGSDDSYFGYGTDTELGYRFTGSKDFEAVKTDYIAATSLSDADADFGVWDIA